MTAEEMLSDHGARLVALEKSNATILEKLDIINNTVTTMSAKLTMMHTPDNCPLEFRVGQLESARDAQWKRIDAHQAALNRAQGGMSVITWLVGGGALAIGTLLGLLLGR
jgi:hypothetical protein